MNDSTLFIVIVLTFIGVYRLGRNRAQALAMAGTRLHSLPSHYGVLLAMWAGLPVLITLLLWRLLEPTLVDAMILRQLPETVRAGSDAQVQLAISMVRNIAAGAALATPDGFESSVSHVIALQARMVLLQAGVLLAVALFGLAVCWYRFTPNQAARTDVERMVRVLLLCSSAVAVLTTVGILASVLYESWLFFGMVSPLEFLFGTHWSPQISLRDEQTGSSASFGAVPLFAGTLMIAMIAMLIAVPVGLMAAIYLSEYATDSVRNMAKPTLEVLAGIPSIVYGFFALLTVAPLIRELGTALGVSVSSASALAVGVVMGIMIIPFISSLSDDVLNAVPQSLRDGSDALGATRNETIRQVVVPAALPGIVAAIMLAFSRAIGETMIVTMAAGMVANLSANPLDSVTTVTAQMVSLLVGDQAFDSPKTLAAFALGLVLFITTLALNYVAVNMVKKYREHYD
ncbi:MAG: phosphate ABC transporter permease subunit PstC [Bacterioplanes sp.]|nr:phosphate ABC transporter permease subunit PstC [Bacterioplanes sp.]